MSQKRIEANDFKAHHRQTDTAFTWSCSLPFALVLVLILRKNVVNEAMTWLEQKPVTASAYSQARYKLKHTAFIELNQVAVVDTLYSDDQYQTFWAWRVLAIDGSKLVLPDTLAVREEFGTIAWSRNTRRASVCLSIGIVWRTKPGGLGGHLRQGL